MCSSALIKEVAECARAQESQSKPVWKGSGERGHGAGDVLTLLLSAPSSSLNKLGFTLRFANDSGWHLPDGMCNGTVTLL